MSMHLEVKTLTKSTTLRLLIIFVMLCKANDQIFGQEELDSFIITKHPPNVHTWFRFSWLHNMPMVHQAPYYLTWFLANCKCCYKEPNLSHEKTCRKWWLSYTSFPMRSSWNDFNNESVKRRVCSPKESNLKGMRVSKLQMSHFICVCETVISFYLSQPKICSFFNTPCMHFNIRHSGSYAYARINMYYDFFFMHMHE